jgi:hypothetical protein
MARCERIRKQNNNNNNNNKTYEETNSQSVTVRNINRTEGQTEAVGRA